MMWCQEGWVWVVAGIALAVLEVLAPGYIFLGFAAGAMVTGILVWLGVLGSGWPILAFVFAVVSLVSWWALRRIFGLPNGQVKIWDRDINDD